MNISGKFGLNLSYHELSILTKTMLVKLNILTQVAAAEFGSQKSGMCFFFSTRFSSVSYFPTKKKASILTHSSFRLGPIFLEKNGGFNPFEKY